jgi:glycosyltransferase involved in cell wall biosynthesis
MPDIKSPLVSICVPAYKRVEFLQRLLESIAIQRFSDFEVVVTDDSNDQSVKELLENYGDRFSITYYKNEKQLGTPENWNACIALAKGKWIKLMHDDDWFNDASSLEEFVSHIKNGKNFLFSSYIIENLESGVKQLKRTSGFALQRLAKNPQVLFAENLIGPPSVTMIERSIVSRYDNSLSWLVDIEYYIRLLETGSFTNIQKPLVTIGMSGQQVTAYSFREAAVEIPEAFYVLKKNGLKPLRNIWVYDGWWRLMRNLNIRTVEQLQAYVAAPPQIILRLIEQQKMVPGFLLKTGIISKLCMFFSYLSNRNTV